MPIIVAREAWLHNHQTAMAELPGESLPLRMHGALAAVLTLLAGLPTRNRTRCACKPSAFAMTGS